MSKVVSSPLSLELFDSVRAVNRLVATTEPTVDVFQALEAGLNEFSAAYQNYCKELEQADVPDLCAAGWGFSQRPTERLPLIDWHVLTAVVLNENVIRSPNSDSLYSEYCMSFLNADDPNSVAFCMLIPGLILAVRNEDCIYHLVDYMVWVRAGFALRSCLCTLAKHPASAWHTDRDDRHTLIEFVENLIPLLSPRESRPQPTGLVRWIRSALDDYPEHADLAAKLALELPDH